MLTIFALLSIKTTISACTIFMANDGKHVWIGNNEDESTTMKYRLWYFPKQKQAYGYMTWSELYPQHEADMYKYPQGGMNEHGLFMDYTAINEIPVILNPSKKNREEEVVNDLLKNCKTVEEALRFISQFNLVKLAGAQLFIGDATGDYATVHGNYVVQKSAPCFALTNYSINNGHTESCWRREAATSYMSNTTAFQLKDITAILSKTAQRPVPSDNIVTNYSIAIDLKKKEINLFFKRNFNHKVSISLDRELKKGKHFIDMVTYFPEKKTNILAPNFIKVDTPAPDSLTLATAKNQLNNLAADDYLKKTYQQLPYRLLLPKKQEANQKYPLVITFHNSFRIGDDNEKQLEPLARIWLRDEIRNQYPAFIVAPQFKQRSSNYTEDPDSVLLTAKPSEEVQTVLKLIDSLCVTYPAIDRNRIYLAGFSMGASTAQNLMSRAPEKFTALLSIAAVPDFSAVDQLNRKPVWLIHGEKDTENPYAGSLALYKLLSKNKNLKFSSYTHYSHNDIVFPFLLNDDLPKWLFEQKK
ncbi:hypothetical protein [Flavobacterium poyangense]|uniref:hypothetical protein n=1 Tax=Flavobacterium poyangense TaxID=2204302 RepID=UPI001FB9D214|nr:hypothetical protein [Flavobacterium sp. JXAS1]